MRRRINISVFVVATLLVTWHGMLLSLPHTHEDPGVPREEISCTASHLGSQNFHLHGAVRALEAHQCLACLVGSTFAVAWQGVPAAPTAAAAAAGAPVRPSCRSGTHTHLPNLRAPPRVV